MRKYVNYLEKLLPFDRVAIKGLAKSIMEENNNRVSKKMPRCITYPNYRMNGTSNKYLYGIV